MRRESQAYLLIKWSVVVVDLLVLNILLSLFLRCFPSWLLENLGWDNCSLVYFVFNIVYLFSVSVKGPILQMRKVRPEQMWDVCSQRFSFFPCCPFWV